MCIPTSLWLARYTLVYPIMIIQFAAQFSPLLNLKVCLLVVSKEVVKVLSKYQVYGIKSKQW